MTSEYYLIDVGSPKRVLLAPDPVIQVVRISDAGPAVLDHGQLTGLGDDDHPQYLLVSGTRPMTGTLTIDTGNLDIDSDVGLLRFGEAQDAVLARDSANILAQRNGTNAQIFLTYNTFTDTGNYERALIGWSGNQFSLVTQAAGSGSVGVLNVGGGTGAGMNLLSSNTARWNITPPGHFLAFADDTYNIGASGGNRPSTGYFGTRLLVGTDLATGHGLQITAGTGAMLYATGAASNSTSAGTNWLRSPKNTVTTFIGDNDTTGGYAVTEYSGALRFNGAGAAWGDLAYFPNAQDAKFKFYLDGSNVGTGVATASVGVGMLAASFDVSVYNFFTDGFNYERLSSFWSSNIAHIITQNAGTGVPRGLRFGTANSSWWEIDTSGHFKPTTTNVSDFGTLSLQPRTGYFGTSVVTPKVESVGVLTLAASGGSNGIEFNTIGTTKQVVIGHTASTVNFVELTGGATGNPARIRANGSDTNAGLLISTKGNETLAFYTDSFNALQVVIAHTAAADRRIILSGSAGGNPLISTSAGDLTINPSIVGLGSLTLGAGLSLGVTPTAPASGLVFVSHSSNASVVLQTSGTSDGRFRVTATNVTALTNGAGTEPNVQVDHANRVVAIAGATLSSSTALIVPASTTGKSSLRLPHGSAPTAPVDGDMWTTTAGLFVRINGGTVGPLT